MSAIKKSPENDVCLACGWEDTGSGICVTREEAIRRDCARFNPGRTEARGDLSDVVFSSAPRSAADFH